MKKITIITILIAFFANIAFATEVNVFSARHYDSDVQLYEKFTAKTGIKVNILSGKDKALQKRITRRRKRLHRRSLYNSRCWKTWCISSKGNVSKRSKLKSYKGSYCSSKL